MHSILDFYPFNLPVGGPFLEFFIVFAIIVLVGGLILRAVLTRIVIDRAGTVMTPSPVMWAQTAGSPYRVAAQVPTPTVPKTLEKGWIPQGDALFTVAYLRRGIPGVANLIVTQAVGERG